MPGPVLVTAAAVAALTVGLDRVLSPAPLPAVWVHLAQVALAGGAAFLLDDAAAALTGVVPPPLWRRRAVGLALGVAVLAPGWLVVLLADPGGSGGTLTAETCALVLLAVAASALVAARGEAEPGTLVAPTVVLAAVGTMLVAGALGRPVFLSDAVPGAGAGLGVVWALLAGTSMIVLLAATRDPAGVHGRRGGRPQRW